MSEVGIAGKMTNPQHSITLNAAGLRVLYLAELFQLGFLPVAGLAAAFPVSAGFGEVV